MKLLIWILGSAIAAVSDPDSALVHAYTLDVEGHIRESRVHTLLSDALGTANIDPLETPLKATAKIGSSIAAIATKSLDNVRFFHDSVNWKFMT